LDPILVSVCEFCSVLEFYNILLLPALLQGHPPGDVEKHIREATVSEDTQIFSKDRNLDLRLKKPLNCCWGRKESSSA
jgi:hypothetical protein